MCFSNLGVKGLRKVSIQPRTRLIGFCLSSVQDAYDSLPLSFVKVFDMMIGEVEYSRYFIETATMNDNELNTLTMWVGRWMFLTFGAIVSIAFMNLLVSYAREAWRCYMVYSLTRMSNTLGMEGTAQPMWNLPRSIVVWFSIVWCGILWCNVVWYGILWCDVIWYGMWCDMVW